MKPKLFLDIETYRNYFLAMFMAEDGRTKAFEMFDGNALDRSGLRQWLENPKFEIVTFNGNNFDIPICRYAVTEGVTCADIKKAADDIIVKGMKPWDFERSRLVTDLIIDHVDLIEVAPGKSSLKIYGGRLHGAKMQDLPIAPDAEIDADQRELLKRYCRNDLRNTALLAKKLEEQINLRRVMSKEYGVDLRSKSDAQIAEAVLKTEAFRRTGEKPVRKPLAYSEFLYEPPAYVEFITWPMRAVLETIKKATFVINPETGHVIMPDAIEKLDIDIAGKAYTIGIGGLHSQESCSSHKADENTLLIDRDVTSYYPNLMLNMKMYPYAIGPVFMEIYREILDERVAAKHAGDTVKADSLKITLNGTFGKTSNKYSILYNPKMMIATTLTGQLSLLMLIEALECRGIPVVSANTDGIVIKCPKDKEEELNKCVALWEKISNLQTEETRYRAIHSRDVNNYIAIKMDGKVKTKGVYATSSLSKNPQNEICTDAVVAYLKSGTPVEETIKGCTDIRKFLTIRTVQGGAEQAGKYLGKSVRWYYSAFSDGPITYVTNGNTVPRSEGSKAVQDLPEEFPTDIDYAWYVAEANDILKSIGAVTKKELPKLPRKNTKLWKENIELGVIVKNHKGDFVWAEAL